MTTLIFNTKRRDSGSGHFWQVEQASSSDELHITAPTGVELVIPIEEWAELTTVIRALLSINYNRSNPPQTGDVF